MIVTDLRYADTIMVGGPFTDPAQIERMRDELRTHRSVITLPIATTITRGPRRYKPSLLAHGTSSKLK